MGPEIIAAIVGPAVAGMVSLIIWQSKRNTETIHSSLKDVHSCVHQVERKVDDLTIEVARNSVTREELQRHVDLEEEWHAQHHEEVKDLRNDMKDKAGKLANDLAELKDTQWKMRLDQLEDRDK